MHRYSKCFLQPTEGHWRWTLRKWIVVPNQLDSWDWCWTEIYPLVNIQKTMERSTMLLMGKSTISIGPCSIAFWCFLMLFVCLPEGIWIDRSKSWKSPRQWWWSRKWELDQKIMQMIGSYLLGCGVWFYPNGSHWSQGLFSNKKKLAFRTNGPSSGENPWCLAFHFGFPRTNNLKTSSWTISGQNLCSVALPSQISTRFGVMPDRTTNIHLGMAGRSSSDHDWKTQVKGPRGPFDAASTLQYSVPWHRGNGNSR